MKTVSTSRGLFYLFSIYTGYQDEIITPMELAAGFQIIHLFLSISKY